MNSLQPWYRSHFGSSMTPRAMTELSGRHTVACYANDPRPGEALCEVLCWRLNTKKDLALQPSRLLLGGCQLGPAQLKKILALFDGIWEVDLSATGLTPAGVGVLARWYREGGSSLGRGVRPKRLDVSLNGLTAAQLEPLLAAVRGLGGAPRWVVVGDLPELLDDATAGCNMHAPRGCVCVAKEVVHCVRAMAPRDPDAVALWERTLPAQRAKARAAPLAEWFSHKCPAKWADGGRPAIRLVGPQGERTEWPSLRSRAVASAGHGDPPKQPPPPPPARPPAAQGVPALQSHLVAACTARLAEERARKEEAAAAEAAEAAAAARTAAAAAAQRALEGAPRPAGFPNSVLVLGRAEVPGPLVRYALLDIEESLAVGAAIEVGGGALDALQFSSPSPEGWLRAIARKFGEGDYEDPRVYLQAKEGDPVEFRLGAAGEFAFEGGTAWVAARGLPGQGGEGDDPPPGRPRGPRSKMGASHAFPQSPLAR